MSVTQDKRHSYALLSAILEGSAAEASQTRLSPNQRVYQSRQKDSDAASVSSFGSTASLLKSQPKPSQRTSSSSKKPPSLVARQRAADDANARAFSPHTHPNF
ncbi:hypothetical protein C8035_v007611 [Colletotrichum spinosum]|uniref:Uncharacterized protein n=2 Tax=Colletotrichum orbiculare species complex TaxID=2707354 RepID=A0A4R8RIX5_COLTR|nr:hypothetical protein C8035_v007611 [Colletotrichum spinosum]TDZ65117.1 hypothetical protein CTRI78_v003689 [Colletotrichum trifolii]